MRGGGTLYHLVPNGPYIDEMGSPGTSRKGDLWSPARINERVPKLLRGLVAKTTSEDAVFDEIDRPLTAVIGARLRKAGVANLEDRNDIVQEVMLKLFRSWHTYEPSRGTFLTWLLFSVVPTVRADFNRSERRQTPGSARSVPVEHADDPRSRAASVQPGQVGHVRQVPPDDDALLAYAAALKQLSVPEAELVQLVVDGYTWREIASQLGVTVGAARMRLHRLRSKLKATREQQMSTTQDRGARAIR